MILPPAHLGCLSLFSQWGLLLACLVANECVRKCHAAARTHMCVTVSEPTTEEIKSPHIGIFFIYIIFASRPRKFCSIRKKKSVNVK